MKKTLLFLSPFVLVACASRQPTPELVDARIAYAHAETGPAAQLNPAGLAEARRALDLAERRQEDSPGSRDARDLAYIAQRKALLAESAARLAQAQAEKTRAEAALAQAPGGDRMALGAEKPTMRPDPASMRRAKEILDGIASVTDDGRELVVTLNASSMFDGDASKVVPSARERIAQVAEAVKALGDRPITVIAYDNHDTPTSTETASERASAVRDALVGEGVPAARVHAEGRADPEHRADCRVEIVVQ